MIELLVPFGAPNPTARAQKTAKKVARKKVTAKKTVRR